MKKTIEKQTFKKGDKVRLITDKKLKCESKGWAKLSGLIVGEVYTVDDFQENGWEGENSVSLFGYKYYHPASKFKLATNIHPLIIKKITKVSRGKKVHTWQFSKNKKISNHSYNQPGTRNKQLAQFIEDIKSGNYEIQ